MIKPIDDSSFYVISVCSNPVRYHSRYRLYKDFRKHMMECGFKLITVEIAYGNRQFEVTDPNNKYDLQLRTDQEIWHKENAISLGIQYLTRIHPGWKYVGWFDGDIKFQHPNIVQEIVQQLQHYDIVQCFSHIIDLGPTHEPMVQYNGFVWSYHKNHFEAPVGTGFTPDKKLDLYYGALGSLKHHPIVGSYWHSGFAWAARREAMDKITIFDQAILGAGDHHMALSLIGQGARSLPGGVTAPYYKAVMNWQAIAEHRIRRNIGYVPGLITHYWHGKKGQRKYVDRWKILFDYKFDPMIDLSLDTQGLYRLNIHDGMRQIKLRDHIRLYFRERNEDSIDT